MFDVLHVNFSTEKVRILLNSNIKIDMMQHLWIEDLIYIWLMCKASICYAIAVESKQWITPLPIEYIEPIIIT